MDIGDMPANTTTAGRDRFRERDRFFVPAVRIINCLADGPHSAMKLAQHAGLEREASDRALAWLKRRKLVEHQGAWQLTELGRFAANGGA